MTQTDQPAPGLLTVPRGQLRLPTQLVIGPDDTACPVDWAGWSHQNQALTCEGTCNALRLTVTITGQDIIRCRCELLNMGEQAVELRQWAWVLELDPPEHLSLVPAQDDGTSKAAARYVSAEPWDYNITATTLAADGQPWALALDYGSDALYVGSDDPLVFGDGLLRGEPLRMGSDRLKVSWHRVEPHWDYNGLLSTRPLHGLWVYEGQTREATLWVSRGPYPRAAAMGATGSLPASGKAMGISGQDTGGQATSGGSATPSDRFPLCIPAAPPQRDVTRVLSQLDRFFVRQGEYAGLFAGGVDHRNGCQLEPHVCRAEYGEFLLHAYLRGGDKALWPRVLTYAERFQQTAVNRSGHPQRGGAVRGRYGDNQSAHPIRSMRGAAFFWDLHRLTGRADFRQTSLGIADYLTRTFPWNNARQGAAIRDLIYLHQQVGDDRYLHTAQSILRTLRDHQYPTGGWFEYWDEQGEAYPYDPPGHHGGEWTDRARLKPEMASYNVNGILDALLLLDAGDLLPDATAMVRKAADWLLAVQDPRGGWRFPSYDSRGLYGYGLYLDAAAMLKAGWYFGDRAFIDAGIRAIDFGFELLDTMGHVPSVTDLPDIDRTECSLTWFFAIEALAALDAAREVLSEAEE